MTNKKKAIFLTFIALVVLTFFTIFTIVNWATIKFLFTQMTTGISIVKEYVLSLGLVGVFSISLIIIICFFFPVISSVPIQLASAVSYGLLNGTLHVWLSVFIASQIVFLFTSTIKVLKRKEDLEEKIKNSNRTIYGFILLAYLAPFIPFLLIHSVAASSGMKWWKYTLITSLGTIPDIVITLWAGVKITTSSPLISYIVLSVIIIVVILSMVFKNKFVNFIFQPKKVNANDKKPKQ